MKKAFLISIATALTLSAQIVDGVAMTVNGRVVTMFEIVKLSESAKISRQDAIEKIIEKKLEEYEFEKQNVKIDDFEIERRMEMIASSNNMSLGQFKEAIEKNFLGVSAYKKELKEKIAKEKLYQKITYQKYAAVDEKDLRLYYDNNKNSFSVPAKIEVLQYSSANKAALEKMVSSPLSEHQGVAKEEVTIETKALDPGLIYVFKNTKEGSFTPIIPIKDTFAVFYVKDKKDFAVADFESVKSEVNERYTKQKEMDAVRDYFEKLKASAKVKVFRLP